MRRKLQEKVLPYKLKYQVWMVDMLLYFKINCFLILYINIYYNYLL